MTKLEIINAVLRRLRETTVSATNDSDYTVLLSSFLNDVMGEAQDAWDWSTMIYRTDFTLSAGDRVVNTQDAAEISNAVITNEFSKPWVRWDARGNKYHMAFEVTSGSEIMIPESSRSYITGLERLGEINTNRPTSWMWYYSTDASLRGVTIEFDATTDSDRDYSFYFYTPQGELALDSTDDATEILLPGRMLTNGVLYYALNERGEEMGEPGNVAERRWLSSLAAAIEDDDRIQKRQYASVTNPEVW